MRHLVRGQSSIDIIFSFTAGVAENSWGGSFEVWGGTSPPKKGAWIKHCLMEHTDCQALKLLVFVACVCCFCFYLLVLFVRFLFIFIFLYCKIVIFTVCCFSVLLDGV